MSDQDLRRLELAALEGDVEAVKRFQVACGRADHTYTAEFCAAPVSTSYKFADVVKETCSKCCFMRERRATKDESAEYWNSPEGRAQLHLNLMIATDLQSEEDDGSLDYQLRSRGYDPDSDSDRYGVDIMRDLRAEGWDV